MWSTVHFGVFLYSLRHRQRTCRNEIELLGLIVLFGNSYNLADIFNFKFIDKQAYNFWI